MFHFLLNEKVYAYESDCFFVFSTRPSLLVVGEAGAVYNWRSKRERVLVVRPVARD